MNAQDLAKITLDMDVAEQVLAASKSSMGMDITPVDLKNVDAFSTRLIKLAEYRGKLFAYLQEKMDVVAPNLAALIGEVVAARLINHAGSLTNLAKVQCVCVRVVAASALAVAHMVLLAPFPPTPRSARLAPCRSWVLRRLCSVP